MRKGKQGRDGGNGIIAINSYIRKGKQGRDGGNGIIGLGIIPQFNHFIVNFDFISSDVIY